MTDTTAERDRTASSPAPEPAGTCAPEFAALRDEFAHRLANGDELGASVAVFVGDDLVVDLWGGFADANRTRPWQRDTLTNVWSISKTVSALAALVLIDRGQLDPDRPVAQYWPEFAAAGKEGVLVKHVLMHTSGVSGWAQPTEPADLYDQPAAAARLAAQPSWWPAGAMSGYHLLDYGHLVGELVRRVDGRALGDFVREELAEPLGADFWLGLPESEHHRVSDVVPPAGTLDLGALPPDSPAFRTFTGPILSAELTWTPEWRSAGIGGAGGQGNARSVARLNSVLAGRGEAGGRRIVAPETVERVFAEHTDGIDLVLGIPLRFALGWAVSNPVSTPAIPEGRVAFWGGWGGSIVIADADRGVTFAYVMNRMSPGIIGSERSDAYTRAVYAAL
ncbi:serine hydrolase domain-containing protein [Agromyces larvae]|uniref:Beta-lactamase family protein n=1 Tax=Agromyces larvae TaxID=2929802 RepID=A0ABY4BUD4_9MICO|nr:serine hydrolase domain-containing protein [Agromyces larvae]UOE42815.1 beta-lactamase family protein [Agromyces larvae]